MTRDDYIYLFPSPEEHESAQSQSKAERCFGSVENARLCSAASYPLPRDGSRALRYRLRPNASSFSKLYAHWGRGQNPVLTTRDNLVVSRHCAGYRRNGTADCP